MYGDDPPARNPQEVAGAVLSLAGSRGVRNSHKTLVPTSSGTNVSKGASQVDLGMCNHRMMSIMEGLGSMLLKAKELDTCNIQLMQNKRLASGSSSESLHQDDSQEASAKTMALPAPAAALPLTNVPATPADAPAVNENGKHDNDKQPPKDLADYENEAFQLLESRVKKGMKRPCASSEKLSQKPGTKAKSQRVKEEQQAKQELPKNSKNVKKCQGWGCLRCRGNVNGCSSCSKSNFEGLKFYSRQEWVQYHQKNGGKSK